KFLAQSLHYQSLRQAIGLPVAGDAPYRRIFYETWAWPKLVKKHQLDLFHSPISYLPFRMPIPAIVTIHDLRSFHERSYYTPWRGAFLNYVIRRSAHQAKKIIAISDFTRKDILNTLPLPPEKVVRIYEGFDPTPFQVGYSETQLQEIRARYRLPELYILSVGHLEPRKNFLRLIKAFHDLRTRTKIPHHLVIVGRENWQFKAFYELVAQLGLKNVVHFTGFVAPDDLAAIYQQAAVFVLPSLFEGFGFPPLESMAAGTAVVCSNSASIPEICQDAALYFDPYQIEDMSAKIGQVLNHALLRQNLIVKGYQNIRRFSWQQCARETAALYQEI
ncbi:glycosyltransferase family 4 protein, partial [candidate division KSB1 bacterium]|nr:glycosyltransferase family 4 protein [candidate division KSB1 bacterium]